jgi:formate-dependent nitrite reductase cytochrome c552 subunit
LADGSGTPPGVSDVCAACHGAEHVAFDASTHAKVGVSCETCHGPMVADHPARKGSMKLEVESTGCRICHTNTYTQWLDSPHAKKGVQCIGCHLSHSQTARLTDEALCGSCHRDVLTEAAHGAHEKAGIGCVKCHASAASSGVAPNHSFTVVADNCVSCHGQSIHQFVVQASTVQKPSAEQQLKTALAQCEASNQEMVPLMAINLGLGLGVGGLGGVVAMLLVFYVRERRARS